MSQPATGTGAAAAAPRLDITRLRLADLPPAARIGAYRAEINNTLETSFSGEVEAEFRSCYLRELHVIHAITAPRRSERTAAAIARDRQDVLCAQLALTGRATGQAGGIALDHRAGSLMMLDWGQPFHVTDLGDREVVNVAVPRRIARRHLADVRGLHGRVLDVDRAAPLAGLLSGVAQQLDRLPAHGAQPLADAIIDLLLLALDVDPRGAARPPSDRRRVLLDRAAQVVDGRLGASDLTPDWLAAKLNLSRSDLYGLFEPAGGVARFIWRRRLEGARTALGDPAESRRIGEIGWAHGFSSEAHFSRAYRQAFDETPSATRRAASRSIAGRTEMVDSQSTILDSGTITPT